MYIGEISGGAAAAKSRFQAARATSARGSRMSGVGFEKRCTTRGASRGTLPHDAELQRDIKAALMPTFALQE